MRLLSNIIIILALALMLGALVKILLTSFTFLVTFILGGIILWFGFKIRPTRRIKNMQNLNPKEG